MTSAEFSPGYHIKEIRLLKASHGRGTMLKGMEKAREEHRVVLGTSTGIIMSSTMAVYTYNMYVILNLS